MRTSMLAVVMAVSACGTPPPELERRRAEATTQELVQGLAVARTALEVFGVLPNYTCGPVNQALGEAIPPVTLPLSCVTVATRAGGMDLTFAAQGCELARHRVTGTLALELGVGADRLEVTADLRSLAVDGKTLPVRVGLGVCGAERRAWATVESVALGDQTFSLDARVGYRQGLPLLGGATLVLDGTGALSGPPTTEVAAEGLEYEVGELAPKNGRLTVSRSDGSHFSVRFTESLARLGQAEVTVGDAAPVEVPLVR